MCENLIFITDRSSNKLIPFKLNRVQCVVDHHVRRLEQAHLPVMLWVLKGRQFGISTYFSNRCLIKSLFLGENSLILPQNESVGLNMFAKVDRTFDRLPPVITEGDETLWRKPTKPNGGLVSREKGTLMRFGWDLDSVIKRESAHVIDAGVSETYQHLHLTEVPLWTNAHMTMGGLLPTVSRSAGTTIVGEFTARSVGDYTHTMWTESVRGQSGFEALFLPWYWHEEYGGSEDPSDYSGESPLTMKERNYRARVAESGYAYPLDHRGGLIPNLQRGVKLTDRQMYWRRARIREYRGDEDMFNREFPWSPEVAFQTSGYRVIAPSVMDKVEAHLTPSEETTKGDYESRVVRGVRRPRFVERPDGQLWVFEKPKPMSRYLVDLDPSSGHGSDPSGAHVLKVSHRRIEIVASFQGKITPVEAARLIARMGRNWRDYMELADPNNPASKLNPTTGRDAEVVPERNGFGEHVIHELRYGLKQPYTRIYRHTDNSRSDWRKGTDYGFPTHATTKITMLQNLSGLCFDDMFVCRCPRTAAEMRALVYLDDREKTAGAPDGMHDDLAMGVGIGAWRAAELGEFRRGYVPADAVTESRTMIFPSTGH